jgi:hypothetical protein
MFGAIHLAGMLKKSNNIMDISCPINVVGNSKSLFNKEYGDLIDTHPTIRFNYLESIDPIHQGKRWDYVATSNPREICKWGTSVPFHTLLFTTWSTACKKELSCKKFNSNVIQVPDDVWMALDKISPKRPSTGLTVLYYLDSLQISHVNIFGFDWKKTLSFYNDEKKDKNENKFHDYSFEQDYCLKLIEKNNWTLHQ